MIEGAEYNVIVSDAALSMLDSNVDFLARVNLNAAKRLMDEILDDVASLSKFPERFPLYQNQFIANNKYRKMVSAKRYLIIYEIDDGPMAGGEKPKAYVDYIVDCRRDYEWMIM